MAMLRLSGADIYYEERGAGQPVVFVHGIWLSSRVFDRQLDYLSRKHRVITFDLRGHGRSEKVHHGHTIARYAADLRELIVKLYLRDAVLAGWSLGGSVVWDYLKQFGAGDVRGAIMIAATPAEMNTADWTHGAFDFDGLKAAMTLIQTDRDAGAPDFVNSLYNRAPDAETFDSLVSVVKAQPASIGSAILFDLAVQDYREALPAFQIPTLLCYGAADPMANLTVGAYLHSRLPQSRLITFEASGHSPHYEESEMFNREVEKFVQSLPASDSFQEAQK